MKALSRLAVELSLAAVVADPAPCVQLSASECVLREPGPLHPDTHTRSPPLRARLQRHGFHLGHQAARDEAKAAFGLAREHENRVALRDPLAACANEARSLRTFR